jgi:hypothetical protein
VSALPAGRYCTWKARYSCESSEGRRDGTGDRRYPGSRLQPAAGRGLPRARGDNGTF